MSLAFRAFYALSTDIATSSGVVTNALHGFASMLLSLVKSQQPVGVAVAFDLPGGTFRDQMTADYKGGRAETPEEIEHQFDLIRSFCEVLNIPVISRAQYEADDILATLATKLRDQKKTAIVVTGDRDSFQLVEDPYVKVLYNRRGVSDYELYDETGIFERCGVEPRRYVLLAAMRGDTSDNLPGVPGVGEKTAAKLLSQYFDFNQIYAHVDELTPKLRENLLLFQERARNNVTVMTLVRDVEIPFEEDSLKLGGWRHLDIVNFFDRYEMRAMKARYEALLRDGSFGPSSDEGSEDSSQTPQQERADRSSLKIVDNSGFALRARNVVVQQEDDRVALLNLDIGEATVMQWSAFLSEAHKLLLSGHGLRSIYRRAALEGVELPDPENDAEVMAYLVDAASGSYTLDDLRHRYLGQLGDNKGTALFSAIDDAQLIARAHDVAEIVSILGTEVEKWQLQRVYRDIELPLVKVLGRMEARGIAVDRDRLSKFADVVAKESVNLEREIQKLAGHDFKVNSAQQLQKVLFEELGLTAVKKIKTGFSTDAASLEAIVDEHEIVPLILKYREVEKLRSTYGTSLLNAIASDGRIHAHFSQTVARTGRLSSEDPNLHNIPVRNELGREIRYSFIPTPGWLFAVADYNQIELRILAHLSQDDGLLAAFAAGDDVHRAIAASVFEVPIPKVTAEQREQAKAVSYGLAYGMETFGLSRRLGTSMSDAKRIMDAYFKGFPTLHAYMSKTVAEIAADGYSRTEFGRIRPFPDLAQARGPQRQAIERQAMNAGIQGLAADIFKNALVRLDRQLSAEGLAARLVLQVHDEVLVEAPPSEQLAVTECIRDALENAASLSVNLDISLKWGSSWADAKG